MLPLPGWESVYRASQNQDGIQEPEDRFEVSVWTEGGWEIERGRVDMERERERARERQTGARRTGDDDKLA